MTIDGTVGNSECLFRFGFRGGRITRQDLGELACTEHHFTFCAHNIELWVYAKLPLSNHDGVATVWTRQLETMLWHGPSEGSMTRNKSSQLDHRFGID